MKRITRVLPLLLLPFALNACLEEDCSLTCPTGLVCQVTDSGDEGCFESCGSAVCAAGEVCVDSVCTIEEVDCPTGQHGVFGNCVPDYTADNVCDPLQECRESCANNATCAQACEDDRSTSCEVCTSALASCESRNSCQSGPYEFNCCHDDFCACFPSHPACGNVRPCDSCVESCGDDTTCFSACANDEPACSDCLGSWQSCRDSGGTDCEALFCECAPSAC